MGVPGADDIMLNYQSTSFHDAQYVRQVLGLKPAPEFEAWLAKAGVVDERGQLAPAAARNALIGSMQGLLPPGGSHGGHA
jgi:ethanolamine ammonia-lyase large subunit